MIITQAPSLSGVRPKSLADLKSYLADESHFVSASADVAQGIAPVAEGTRGVTLTPIDSHAELTCEQRERVKKAILTFAAKNATQFKTIAPGAALPLEGIEFVFASRDAWESFTDPKRTSLLGPLVKSARALSELIDVVTPIFPVLRNNPYVQVATVIVKFGDTAYQLHAEVSAAQKPAPQATT